MTQGKPTTPSSALVPAHEDQDELLSSAFAIVNEAIAQQAFPAASIAVTHQNKLVALKSFGHLVYEREPEGGPSKRRLGRGH